MDRPDKSKDKERDRVSSSSSNSKTVKKGRFNSSLDERKLQGNHEKHRHHHRKAKMILTNEKHSHVKRSSIKKRRHSQKGESAVVILPRERENLSKVSPVENLEKNKTDKVDKKIDKYEKLEKLEKLDKIEKLENKLEKLDKLEKLEKLSRIEKLENLEKKPRPASAEVTSVAPENEDAPTAFEVVKAPIRPAISHRHRRRNKFMLKQKQESSDPGIKDEATQNVSGNCRSPDNKDTDQEAKNSDAAGTDKDVVGSANETPDPGKISTGKLSAEPLEQ
uniref:Serine/threonine-protein kinase PRP4 homolog n=1 Tax=Panagrellus redivivus TaxID=6233 RepID=A0A7E4V3A8_PANRE